MLFTIGTLQYAVFCKGSMNNRGLKDVQRDLHLKVHYIIFCSLVPVGQSHSFCRRAVYTDSLKDLYLPYQSYYCMFGIKKK